jgi:hypothetical protein
VKLRTAISLRGNANICDPGSSLRNVKEQMFGYMNYVCLIIFRPGIIIFALLKAILRNYVPRLITKVLDVTREVARVTVYEALRLYQKRVTWIQSVRLPVYGTEHLE